jgi:hypothetical protein
MPRLRAFEGPIFSSLVHPREVFEAAIVGNVESQIEPSLRSLSISCVRARRHNIVGSFIIGATGTTGPQDSSARRQHAALRFPWMLALD